MAVTTTYTFDSTRTEFIANSNGTGNSQFLSNVTTLSGGGFALTYGTENGANDVPYVSIYNTATGAVSPLFLPYDASGTDMQGEPVITQLANGNVLVVWKEGAGGGNAIVQTVFDPLTGNAIGPREVIATAIAGNTDPEITVLAGGNYVITYVNAAGGITTNVYNSVGSFQSGPTIIGPGCSDPAIAATADGGFAVVLLNGGNIFSATYDSVGNFVSQPKFEVTGNTNSAPQVAALKGGGFAIVYDDSSFVGLPGIGLKLSTAAQDTVIRVDTFNSANGDRDPEITVLENGFIVVTWTHEFSGTDDDIYGHIFDANGTSISVSGNDLGGGVFVIDSSTLDQNQSSLAALLNGMFVTTWTNAQGDGSGDGISAEVLELTRTITGDGAVDFIIGDELRDTIFGGGGGDHLAGGKGNDSLHGDAGDDVLVVKASDGTDGAETLDGGIDRDTLELDIGNGGDFTFDLRNDTITSIEEIDVNGDFGNTSVATVVLNADQFGAGVTTDAVFARIGDVAPALTVFMEGVTNLNLSGLTFIATYTVTINGDGDSETIIGTSQNDTINGGGGIDTLTGGAGDDQYFVDSADDIVTEDAGAGTGLDTIFSSASYTIAANVERLELTGSGNINATGRDGAEDTLIGNSGNNTLDGKSGNDTMRGLLGNDIYIVSSAGDVVDEVTGGGGADTIQASVSYTISAGVETLQLTGTDNINATGLDTKADALIGNSGNNIIDGKGGGDLLRGGLGNDTLTGGTGNDLFRFDTALNAATNMDVITDFNVVNDTIQLENAIFTLLATTGVLSVDLFKDIGNVGAVLDGDDRIVYDHNTGVLSYDADGSGVGLAIQFANITNHALLLNTDFVVI
jgi:RTX calcium-binding nonapeptide repeat (4 copies)